MFLSTENPPNDPLSSSSNLLHLTTSSHELGQSHHLSNFSIRDYAYSNRKTNIKNNWPFSPKSLQLLSTHGVTDPLPPFQKFSTVKSQFETTSCSSSSGKRIVSCVHRGRDQKITETSKRLCSHSKIVENGTSVSKSRVDQLVVATTSKKSGRGMVKSKDDSFGGLVMTSESVMASKTCPICKTFSSASNTTLNAHIDQCLSVDSEMPPVSSSKPNRLRLKPNTASNAHVDQCLSVDSALPPVSTSKPNKNRVKPRTKVKTMVDIYASAKGCTLEDLDKRNGTKWVSILSYTNKSVADKSEVSKKRKVSPVGVGPVYIDAKGQKLRILSEFSEKKTSTLSREQHRNGSSEKKCLSQGSKGNNRCLRKNRRGKKPHKYVKLTNHKSNASELIPAYQKGFSGEGSSKGHRRIYNQRMLAKRSLISKKLNEKGHKFYASRDQPSENDDDDDDDSMSGGHPTVLRVTDLSATDSYRLNKQKLGSKIAGSNETSFESKRAQSRSFRVRVTEKEEKSLERGHTDALRLKKSLVFQEDKHPPRKSLYADAVEVSDASPRANSMRKLSPPFVANSWRRLSMPVELKKVRLDFSEKEDEEETWKWESEMTQERELSDDDYLSGDDGQTDEVPLRSNPSSCAYDDYSDDDEESSGEEEDNVKRDNVMEKTDDTGVEFYQSDTPPSTEIMPSEQAMYYSEEARNMIYGQTNVCEEDVRFDSNVGQGSLFVEVDTIPIPGPPGSFLPSPRDMGFDENLGNSSVITSQVQSSMDQLDRNSSESPVSAVSNFAAGRLNFPAELSSSFRENFSSDIPVSYATTPMSIRVPSHQGTITEADPITIDRTIPPSRFRNNDNEPCCCQRKEIVSEGITLNHQASHLLQRRAASSSMNLTKSPTSLDPNHHAFEQSPYMIQQDLVDHQSKFSSRGNLNGAVPPSPSTPVLRLMGKDLMVMNQGEADEGSSQSSLKPPPPPQLLDPPAGTGLYFNSGLYLRNSFESTLQSKKPPQAQAQASGFRNNFEHVRYFSPS